MSDYQTMLYSREGPAARIIFNRPERRNATNVQFYKDLLACLDRCEEDPEVRAIILGGAGPVFCAGWDLKFAATAAAQDHQDYDTYLIRAWDRIHRHPRPVIARVHGDALGGGCYIATRCDLIVAKKTARFAMREIQAGAQSGGTHLLTIGKQRAMEMNLLGRYVSAGEAERWGLINRCVESDEALDEQVQEWVGQLVALPPLAVKETKEAANFPLDLAGFELHWRAPFGRTLLYTEDHLEARRAVLEKRKPIYRGRLVYRPVSLSRTLPSIRDLRRSIALRSDLSSDVVIQVRAAAWPDRRERSGLMNFASRPYRARETGNGRPSILVNHKDLCGECPLWDGETGNLYWTDCIGFRFPSLSVSLR